MIRLDEACKKGLRPWEPELLAELNGQEVKLIRGEGRADIDPLATDDEFLLVWRGTLQVHLDDRVLTLRKGEGVMLPRGVERWMEADGQADFLLFEPSESLSAARHLLDLEPARNEGEDPYRSELHEAPTPFTSSPASQDRPGRNARGFAKMLLWICIGSAYAMTLRLMQYATVGKGGWLGPGTAFEDAGAVALGGGAVLLLAAAIAALVFRGRRPAFMYFVLGAGAFFLIASIMGPSEPAGNSDAAMEAPESPANNQLEDSNRSGQMENDAAVQ